MEQTKRNRSILKTITSRIISDSPDILEVIGQAMEGRSSKFIVQINNGNQSWGNKYENIVTIGIGHLAVLYDICSHFCQTYHLKLVTDNDSLDYASNDNICIDDSDLNEEDIEIINAFTDNKINFPAILVFNALAFTLYHEFGHIKYDDDRRMLIENERHADLFAQCVVRKKCSELSENIGKSPCFLGALLAYCLILKVCDPNLTEVDQSHPHPIERLYELLENFHIEPNSSLWEYVFDMVEKWINENNIAMTFQKDSSITLKDKLLDAYLRFKK